MAATVAILTLTLQIYVEYLKQLSRKKYDPVYRCLSEKRDFRIDSAIENREFEFFQSLTGNNSKTVNLREKLLLIIRKHIL